MTDYAQYECTLCGELVTGYSNYHLHKCKPRERTEDWIPKGYVQDVIDPTICVECGIDAYKHSHKTGLVYTINGKTYCSDCGTKKRKVRITEDEYQWLLSLCTRQG